MYLSLYTCSYDAGCDVKGNTRLVYSIVYIHGQ